jgi:hypothetical protein
MRVAFKAVLMIIAAVSAHAGQVAVTPPNAIVAAPAPAIVPTPAPAIVPTPGVAGTAPVLSLPGAVPPLGGAPAAVGGGAAGGAPLSPAVAQSLTQQVLSFDVQRLTTAQARQAIPLLERLIAAPPAGLSLADLALLDSQLTVLRAIAR